MTYTNTEEVKVSFSEAMELAGNWDWFITESEDGRCLWDVYDSEANLVAIVYPEFFLPRAKLAESESELQNACFESEA